MTLPIVKRYVIALDQYKWVGLATFTVAVGVSGIIAMQPAEQPNYEATGQLQFVGPPITFSNIGSNIQNQAKERTLDMFRTSRVVEAAGKKVRINPRRLLRAKINTKKMTVSYEEANKEKAIGAVNALMEEMVEESRLINTAGLREIMQEVQKRLPEALKELKEVEQDLEDFKRKEEALLLTSRARALPAAIAGSQQQQRQIELQLEGVNAQTQSLEQQLGLNADQAYVAQALAADPIIAQLRVQLFQIESELERLLLDYREEYPPIVELRRQKQVVEQQLEERASEVLGGNGIAAPLIRVDRIRVDSSLDPARQQLAGALISLQTQREQLQRQLESVQKTERELRREYATIPNMQLELARLEQQVAFKKATYDKMQGTLADARVAEAETTSSLTIASAAYANDVEVVEKNMPLMLAIGGLGGIVVGAGLIFVLGMLSGKFYSWQEVKGSLQEKDVPLLGVLPDVMVFDPDTEEMPLLMDRSSPYLEFYEKLRVSLRRLGDKPVKMVLLSSAGRGEGKTFCAYNMAIAAARSGKRTLLIEADLRSPSQVRSLSIVPNSSSATTEPLRYYAKPSDCIRLVPEVENLYVIPSPGLVAKPAVVLESSEMQRLLAHVRHRFDLVIVDSPALSANNDALTLEPYTDGIILIARPYYTISGMLAEAIEQLTASDDEDESTAQSGPRLLGAIVNGADIAVNIPLEVDEVLEIPYEVLSDGAIESEMEPVSQIESHVRS